MDTTTNGTLRRSLSDGEPRYLFDRRELVKNIRALDSAFRSRYSNFRLAYSYKTNYLADICRTVSACGGLAEVVSPYEYQYAGRLGIPDDEIIFNGVTPCAEMKVMAAENGCMVNVDNYDELRGILSAAEKRGAHIKVGLRVNFSVMNGVISRFGTDVESEDIEKCMRLLESQKHVRLGGLHCHIGSSRQLRYWGMKATRMAVLAKKYGAEYVDLGGGMFGPMPGPLAAQFEGYEPEYGSYAEIVCGLMKKFFPEEECRLIIEPGAALVGNTMEMEAVVTGIKKVRGKQYVTVNCNSSQLGVISEMKELPIDILPSEKDLESVTVEHAVVCGNTCLEYDYLAGDFSGRIAIGDRLVFKNVGAYSLSSSRQFIVPRPEVREKSTGEVLRPAETELDMFQTYLASAPNPLDV